MKVKCFACALVAGMALSAVAVADPGQAGGVTVQPVIGEATAMPKGLIPGRARYHYATRTWTRISEPHYVGQESSEAPALRGTNLLWSAIDPSGFYWNHLGSTLAANEIRDGGVLCGDIGVTVHTVNQISFAYQTTTLEDGTQGVSLNLYWDLDPLCAVGPNGGVADNVGAAGCIAANGAIYDIVGLPASDGVAAAAWLVDIDLTGFESMVPAGPFGWSFHSWVGFTAPTGPLLAANNQIAAPGAENGFDVFTTSPQGLPFVGNFWFGATFWAQFWFEVYSSDTMCAPATAGACCLADLSCVAAEEIDCQAQGGTWTSAGQPCAGTFFCYPAPANDDCLNAQVITGFGQFAYDNRGATTGSEGDPSCAPQGEDVWFSWEAPCTGSVTVSTCLLNLNDDLIAIYQGSDCGNLTTEVACDDDGCGVVGEQSSATFNVTQGTDYLIRAGTWNGTDGAENLIEIIQGGDCTGGPQFCDADWCQDGSVGVPDIFCFLSDWFALVPEARNYGGTPGVPAIFAFLSIWFSTGQGPCTP